MDVKEIKNRLKFHPQTDDQIAAHERTRELFKLLVEELEEVLPSNTPRENALVVTNLEQAHLWAHNAIAICKSE